LSARGPKRLALLGDGPGPDSVRGLLAQRPEIQLCGVLGPPTQARRVGVFATLDALLSGARPDLAVIGAPAGRHLDAAGQLLARGVDLLVEPPVALESADADALESIAERLGRTYVTAAPMRHASALRLAREALERGLCGALQGVELHLSKKAGGELHALDAAELLAGPIERVRMFDPGELFTEHARGRVRIRIPLAQETRRPAVHCVGTRASVEVGATAVVLVRDGRRTTLGPGLCEWEARQRVLDDFLARRTDPAPDPDHGAQSMQWLAAARRSLVRNRWEYA
jgi:hypothetical protein